MKRWTSFMIWTALLAIGAAATAQEHTGYWKAYTPRGDSFECQRVTSKDIMERVLGEAGWEPEKTPFPDIDWSTNEAIVIAPRTFPHDAELAFYGLSYSDDELHLNYGWHTLPKKEIIERSDGTSVFTSGSRYPTEPSTIIVAFDREIASGRQFYCVGP